jgi:hypothetical protein
MKNILNQRNSFFQQVQTFWLVWLSSMVMLSCNPRDFRPINPCTISTVVNDINVENIDNVDMLFVVDNSGSMEEEQIALQKQFPRLIEILVSGDIDNDNIQDFPPVRSLRVGVVSTDMGTGGVISGDRTCPGEDDPVFGDDGVLVSQATNPILGCNQNFNPPYLTFEQPIGQNPNQNQDAIDNFVDDFECLATLGDGGCALEQPLEAMLKAVTPGSSSIRFFNDTTGHADDPETNGGFLREDSLLAIVMVTDEDDCSASDPRIYDLDFNQDPYTSPDFQDDKTQGIRCNLFAEAGLYPVQRYVDGITALRDNPDNIVFAMISGVPADLVSDGSNTNFGPLIGANQDPRMATSFIAEDSNARLRIAPSCQRCAHPDVDPNNIDECFDAQGRVLQICVDPDKELEDVAGCDEQARKPALQTAVPPERLIEVAAGLEVNGVNTVVQTICQDDFTPALDSIISKIADVLRGSCLPRALNPDNSGEVNCVITEALPLEGTITKCSQVANRGRLATPVAIENGREVCQVEQVIPSSQDREARRVPSGVIGWFYDDYTNEVQSRCGTNPRIGFTIGAEPTTGSEIRLECLQPVQGGSEGNPTIEIPCRNDTDCHFDLSNQDGQRALSQFLLQFNLDQGLDEQPMVCEEESRTCQIPCANDADCPGGFVCFDADHGNVSGIAYCLNPTCSVN